MRSGSRAPLEPSGIFVPARRPPGTATINRWRRANCGEVLRPGVRSALWDFVRETAPLLHPGLTAPAEPALLSGLNDGRDADVKTGMLGTDTAPLCLILRTHLGTAAGPGPHRRWRETLGRPGVRTSAAVVTGIEQVNPQEAGPLLAEPLPAQARPWLVISATVADRAGSLSVDPGDGVLRHVLDFAVVRLDRPGPLRDRPSHCPHCDQTRVRRYSAFDLCPDCGWFDQPAAAP